MRGWNKRGLWLTCKGNMQVATHWRKQHFSSLTIYVGMIFPFFLGLELVFSGVPGFELRCSETESESKKIYLRMVSSLRPGLESSSTEENTNHDPSWTFVLSL